MRILKRKIERKYDSHPTSYNNDARIINSRLFGDGIMRESKILTSFQICENQADCVLKLVLEWGYSHVRMKKIYIFLLAGHKIDFIVTREENKSYGCYSHVARASSFTLAK